MTASVDFGFKLKSLQQQFSCFNNLFLDKAGVEITNPEELKQQLKLNREESNSKLNEKLVIKVNNLTLNINNI